MFSVLQNVNSMFAYGELVVGPDEQDYYFVETVNDRAKVLAKSDGGETTLDSDELRLKFSPKDFPEKAGTVGVYTGDTFLTTFGLCIYTDDRKYKVLDETSPLFDKMIGRGEMASSKIQILYESGDFRAKSLLDTFEIFTSENYLTMVDLRKRIDELRERVDTRIFGLLFERPCLHYGKIP